MQTIRQLREEKKMTLEQVATRASITRAYLSEIERTGRNPTLNVLRAIAKALDVPVERIVSEEKQK